MDREFLRAAVIANHVSWFRRSARADGGGVARVAGIELAHAGGHGMVVLPPGFGHVNALAAHVRGRSLTDVGAWSLDPDPELGARLIARGFGWGWQPHWMGVALNGLPDEPLGHDVREIRDAVGPFAADLPNLGSGHRPHGTAHLAVRSGGVVVGHVAVNPWRGVAGIYSMGVVEGERRRGIGRSLLLAALHWAADRGCSHAVLNATEMGEPLYRAAGFASFGFGQTWWLGPGPQPTARQIGLAEAIGFGSVAELEALDPTAAEISAKLPGGTSPARLAVLTDQAEALAWLLDRAPASLGARYEPWGGTLLHLAVEWDRPAIAAALIARGIDRAARDRTWRGTALDWAERARNAALIALLRG